MYSSHHNVKKVQRLYYIAARPRFRLNYAILVYRKPVMSISPSIEGEAIYSSLCFIQFECLACSFEVLLTLKKELGVEIAFEDNKAKSRERSRPFTRL